MNNYHTEYLESLINLTLQQNREDAYEINKFTSANPTRNV